MLLLVEEKQFAQAVESLWKILTELHISCCITLGTVSQEGENLGHPWNKVCINGIWYNVDLTWDSESKNIKKLLQSDADFPYHVPYSENKREQCLISYSKE